MKNENSKIQIPNVDKGYTTRTADALLLAAQTDLILLNAGAGYGKTQALAYYVRHCAQKSAWYSVSAADNDLMTFLLNLTESVRQALTLPDDDFPLSLLLTEEIDRVMEQLILWLDENIDFINLILDDFQEITNPDLIYLLDLLIETLHQKIRLFVVEKRSLPDVFAKYMESGRALCLGIEELKFAPAEIEVLLTETLGQSSAAWAKHICDCTEGWPVGIAQILLQLRGQKKSLTTEKIADACEKLEVSDYFMTRVYKMLPFDIQIFLKKTAVLDYMTPAICNTITGIYNSAGMLSYLANEKLFVQSLGAGSSLYRYHSIFQRFLLTQTTKEEQEEALRTAAFFLLKTNDKIQAGEYACRAQAADLVQAVIEVLGDSMLEEQMYQTLERWFSFLEQSHCEQTAKTKFIHGKYLMALGRTAQADEQIAQAGKAFYEEGHLKDYKKVLLFWAACRRRAGQPMQAMRYLKQAAQDPESSWNKTAEAISTEQLKLYCCLHRLKDAEKLLRSLAAQGIRFGADSFLADAQQTFLLLQQTPPDDDGLYELRIKHKNDRFLLINCLLAEQMKHAYRTADTQTVSQKARTMIQNSEYETLQTAASWQMLAVLSWTQGNYRQAVEQSHSGDAFLHTNHIWDLHLMPKHQQILNEIRLLHRTDDNARLKIACAPPDAPANKIKIQCMGCFRVFLPASGGEEMKWRTKKARELFAYLFHLHGRSASREALIELLWPEAGAKSAVALFHTTLYSIRQSFAQEGLGDLISYENKTYSLTMQLVDSDLDELQSYLDDAALCETNPERMMQLYTGSYMDSSGYLWSYAMARKLENRCLAVLKAGADKRMAEGTSQAAIPFLQRMLEADPYNEAIVSQLIICLYRNGRQSEAKQQYDRIQKLFREDLELDFANSFKEIVARA